MTAAIHPQPEGPTRAESPYKRKLQRIYDDLRTAERIAPDDQKGDLCSLLFALENLIHQA